MFSIPSIWKNTAAKRNEQRMEEYLARVQVADSRLRSALDTLDNMRSGFENITEAEMAGLDIGQVQNMAHSVGRLAHDVQRAMEKVNEAIMEAVVIGSGFESVQQ